MFQSPHRLRLTLLVLGVLLVMSAGAAAQDDDRPDLAALEARAAALFPDSSVVPERLQYVAAEYSGVSAAAAAIQDASGAVAQGIVSGGLVTLDIEMNGDLAQVEARLRALGLRGGGVYQNRISGLFPAAALPTLDGVPGIASVSASLPLSNVGSVTSQADSGMRVDIARNVYGVDGSGVTVAVLSNSYNCYAPTGRTPTALDDITSGDLPIPVSVVEYSNCSGAPDEGRAMMQLVHDLAPGAALAFHTALEGEAAFAAAIQSLSGQGIDILVDDITYLAEAFFQDDIIAQSADSAAAGGIAYFSAMGNYRDDAYESSFVDSGQTFTVPNTAFCITDGATYRLHDFNSGATVDTRQSFTDDGVSILLQWYEPHPSISGGALASEMALFIVQAGTNNIVACGDSDFLSAGDPVRIAQTSGFGSSYELMVGYRQGTAQPDGFKYINTGQWMLDAQYPQEQPTGYGHSNAANVAGVGAVDYVFDTIPASFTSLGGTRIRFDTNGNPVNITRMQPSFSAEQNTDTTFFSPGYDPDGNGYPNFAGTSAAAPHAAAVAALLKQCEPSLTPAEIYTALAESAVDVAFFPAGVGYDFWSGAGVIDAKAALDLIADIEIELFGNAQPIANGASTPAAADGTDFGAAAPGQAVARTFTIRNNTANCGYLALDGAPPIEITGAHAGDFTVTAGPTDTDIKFNDPDASFTVTFAPTGVGVRTATVIVNSNDPDSPAYTFAVRGEAEPTPDINGDGYITPSDVVAVINRLGQTNPAYDLNGDGSVTAADVQIVIDLLGTTVTPAP